MIDMARCLISHRIVKMSLITMLGSIGKTLIGMPIKLGLEKCLAKGIVIRGLERLISLSTSITLNNVTSINGSFQRRYQ